MHYGRHISRMLLLVGLASSPIFASTTIFNDFGSAYSYNSDTRLAGEGFSEPGGYFTAANPFTSTGDFNLTQIDVAVANNFSRSESFAVDLDSDNGGTPGSVLESWTVTGPLPAFGTCCGIETLTASSSIQFSAGAQYWLVISPADPSSDVEDVWNFNNTGATGNVEYQNTPGGPYLPDSPNTLGAFDVLGDTTAPEPASFAMVAGALGVIGAFLRCRRRA